MILKPMINDETWWAELANVYCYPVKRVPIPKHQNMLQFNDKMINTKKNHLLGVMTLHLRPIDLSERVCAKSP